MAPPQRRGAYLGAYRLLVVLAVLGGPPAALALIEKYGFRAFFGACALAGFFSLLLLIPLKTPSLPPGEALSPAGSVMGVLRNRRVWPLLLGIALANIGYSSLLTYAAIYISETGSMANPGAYFLYFGLAGIAANLCAGFLSDRFGRPFTAWPALILLGLSSIALLYCTVPAADFQQCAGRNRVNGSMVVLLAWLVDVSGEAAPPL